MPNIRRLSNTQLTFDFQTIQSKQDSYFNQFLSSSLGGLYQAIPFKELVSTFNLVEHSKGPESYFSPRGKLGLMILKHHSCLSDQDLLERLNSDFHYQFFCDIQIDPFSPLKNHKIISAIRCELAANLCIDESQKALAKHWLPYMDNLDSITMDATCYESDIRYPTDVKLLFESLYWLRGLLKKLSKKANLRMPRSKYRKWKKRYVNYSKKKRKSKKERRKLIRSLLWLLKKHLDHLVPLHKQFSSSLKPRQHKRYATIKKIKVQQWSKYFDEHPIKDRIVSIDQPHLRPIVRGKEIKKVEFGSKSNNFQIDGISFIDKISFDNFNECNRFIPTVFKAQNLTGKKVKIAGADKIYQTNKNRSFVSKKGIKTDFKPKGPPLKDPVKNKQRTQLKQMITKERASRMEGSFGTEKQHYGLSKVPMRTKETEILFIFFGIHTANAVRIGKRIRQANIAAHQQPDLKAA